MIQCHIKPLPPHVSHVRGRFQFLAGPRDPADTRKSGEASDGNDAGLFIVAGDRLVIVDPKANADRDEPSAPFIMTERSYAVVKEAHGKSLIIEPVGNPEESNKLEMRAQEIAAARIKAAEVEAAKIEKALREENKTLKDQLGEARQKIADFETVMAQGSQIGKKR